MKEYYCEESTHLSKKIKKLGNKALESNARFASQASVSKAALLKETEIRNIYCIYTSYKGNEKYNLTIIRFGHVVKKHIHNNSDGKGRAISTVR